jgi:tRNA (cmo5U34)-methyltransferase
LSILSPQEDEALLEEAAFSGASLFYAGLSFRGWVAYGDDLRWSGCCGDN